jgi:hypothetical protein
VVTDDDLQPLFAVEFDGDSHAGPNQQRRDRQKDTLCERFGLPLLRINSKYVCDKFRQMDLLSWFVSYWFAQRMIDNAYESGDIPTDAYVDPMLMVTLPGRKEVFPLWLTAEVRTSFRAYHQQGRCIDPGPSSFIGVDAKNVYRGIAYMAVTQNDGLIVETAMRAKQFNVPCSEILDAILDHEMFEAFTKVLSGAGEMASLDAIRERVDWYRKTYTMMMSSMGTQSDRLRSDAPRM